MFEAANASKMSLTKRHTPENSRGSIKTKIVSRTNLNILLFIQLIHN